MNTAILTGILTAVSAIVAATLGALGTLHVAKESENRLRHASFLEDKKRLYEAVGALLEEVHGQLQVLYQRKALLGPFASRPVAEGEAKSFEDAMGVFRTAINALLVRLRFYSTEEVYVRIDHHIRDLREITVLFDLAASGDGPAAGGNPAAAENTAAADEELRQTFALELDAKLDAAVGILVIQKDAILDAMKTDLLQA